MFVLPQAYVLVAQQLCVLLYPAVLAGLLLAAAKTYSGVPLPVPVIVLAAVAFIPCFHIGTAKLWLWRMKRKAAKMGAVLPPMWTDKSIGNITIMKTLVRSWSDGYLSDHLWERMHDINPTFAIFCLWDMSYVSSDAEVVKAVLATDFISYIKGERFDAPMKSVLGTGVFNSDGEMWKFHRSMTRPFFSRNRVSHFDIFNRHADEAISKMKERLRSGYAIDFQDLISRFTLDSATEFLFGLCVHSLQTSLPYPHNAGLLFASQESTPAEDFAKAFAEAQKVIAYRSNIESLWPWFELTGSKTAGAMRTVDAFIDPILKQAVAKAKEERYAGFQEKEGEIGEDETLLGHLVRLTSDPVVLHDEVLNIMIAGRDTTASTLTSAVYFLSQYPAIMERLRGEILEKVGPTRRPTYDDIREMKLLRAVLNETLRLYPAVPWNVRYAAKDSLLPSGDPAKPFFVPAGVPVNYSVHCMHKRKDYWGPDAEEFDPDRFIDERVHKYLTPNPFIFLPFNAGPRICLGQQFAYNEMSFFLIRLLQNFKTIEFDVNSQPPEARPPADWQGVPGRKGVEKFRPKAHLTLYSEGGMWMKMGEAVQD